ncbi:WAS/WASL-interacting protein family member 3-like [Coturnix japonica]|uniref:WAS/WASL-interacting protein family member 3-like n=1 Tax=Coturnix japonica TaxID=93934 RepID=UPI00077766E4|nr:WAS/WASL-interacting protein family member 3-like [Coturnix japonica]
MFPVPGLPPRPPPPRSVLQDGPPAPSPGTPQRLLVPRRVRQFSVLQARSDEEGAAGLKSLRAEGGGGGRTMGGNTSEETPGMGAGGGSAAAGGLLLRRVPTPNTYMDDPFRQPPTSTAPRPRCSNTERRESSQLRRPPSAGPGGSTVSLHGGEEGAAAQQRWGMDGRLQPPPPGSRTCG